MKNIKDYLDKIARGEDTVPEDLDIECNYTAAVDDNTIYIIPERTNKPLKIVRDDEWIMTLNGYEIEISKKFSPTEAECLLMGLFDTIDIGYKTDLIKCKDCKLKHYSESHNLWCDIFERIMPEDGYCCFGER